MGAVLLMAAGQGTSGGPAKGALLLAVYSLGLGVPFIVTGLGISRLVGALKWLRTHARVINVVSGALLVLVGVLLFTDRLVELSTWMQQGFVRHHLDFWSSF